MAAAAAEPVATGRPTDTARDPDIENPSNQIGV